jgi:hypothetical protein
VCTIYRELEMSVGAGEGVWIQASVRRTGAVGSLITGKLEEWIPIVHAIEPRYDRDPKMKDARNMMWASCYFELRAG